MKVYGRGKSGEIPTAWYAELPSFMPKTHSAEISNIIEYQAPEHEHTPNERISTICEVCGEDIKPVKWELRDGQR